MYSNTQNRAAALAPNGFDAVHAAMIVDHHDLARLHIADELGADDIERAGLADQHPAADCRAFMRRLHAPQHQRPHAQRIAHADTSLLSDMATRAVGPDHLLQRIDQPVDHR